MSKVYKPSKRYPFQWTEERNQELKDLWPLGLTCLQIGVRMGTGRHQISGKAHRLGLPPHPAYRNPPDDKRRKRDRDAEVARLKNRDREAEAVRRYQGEKHNKAICNRGYIQIVEYEIVPVRLGKEECRWVVDEPSHGAPAVYCCQPNVYGKSYCPEHHALCVRQGTHRKDLALMEAG
jgi:hypothetical protein